MNRYKDIKKINNALKTVRFPSIPVSSDDTVIVSRDSDRLDIIANTFYYDASLYWIIAIANNLGKGTLEIPPGTVIRIPSNIGNIIQQYNLLNS